MNKLKIKFKQKKVIGPRCSLVEIVGTLNFHTAVSCEEQNFKECGESMTKTIVDSFKHKLYGEIIRAIDMAECETQANRFNYSTSADERISKAFLELRKAIPEMTYN